MPVTCVTEPKYTCPIENKKFYMAFIPAVLLTVGIAIISLMESSYVPQVMSAKDKLIHGVMYALLAISWAVPLADKKASLWVLLSVIGYGALMEVLQRLCTLTRSGEMADLYADAIGAAIGIILVIVWRRLSSRLH